MKNRPIIWTMAIAVIFGLTLIVQPVAAETYKTGLSLALTGPTSDAGVPYAMGVEDFFRYANDEKLLGDDTIDCTIKDDQYKTDITKRNFEEFLDMDIPIYLNYSTGSTLGLNVILRKSRCRRFRPLFMPEIWRIPTTSFCPSPLIPSSAWVWPNMWPTTTRVISAKIAMFLHPSAFGRGPLADVEKAIAAGLNVELVEVVEHGKDLDNTATLKRLVENKVQYVISQTVQSPVATFIKDAKRLGSSGLDLWRRRQDHFYGRALYRRKRSDCPGR